MGDQHVEHTPVLDEDAGHWTYWLLSATIEAIDAFTEARSILALNSLVLAALLTYLMVGGVSVAMTSLSFIAMTALIMPAVPALIVFFYKLHELRGDAEDATKKKKEIKEIEGRLQRLVAENPGLIEGNRKKAEVNKIQEHVLIRLRGELNSQIEAIKSSDENPLLARLTSSKTTITHKEERVLHKKIMPNDTCIDMAFSEWLVTGLRRVGKSCVPTWCYDLWYNERIRQFLLPAWHGVVCGQTLGLVVVSTAALFSVSLTGPVTIVLYSVCAIAGLLLAATEFSFGDGITLPSLKKKLTRMRTEKSVAKAHSLMLKHQKGFLEARERLLQRKIARRETKLKATQTLVDDAQKSVVHETPYEMVTERVYQCPEEETFVAKKGEQQVEVGYAYPLLDGALYSVNALSFLLLFYETLRNDEARYWIGQGLAYVGLTFGSLLTPTVLILGGIGIVSFVAVSIACTYLWTQCSQQKKYRLQAENKALYEESIRYKEAIDDISKKFLAIRKKNNEKIDRLVALNQSLEKEWGKEASLQHWLFSEDDIAAYRAQMIANDACTADRIRQERLEAFEAMIENVFSDNPSDEVDEAAEEEVAEDPEQDSCTKRSLYLIAIFFKRLVTPLALGLGVCAAAGVAFIGTPVLMTVLGALCVAAVHTLVVHFWGYDLDNEIERAERENGRGQRVLDRLKAHYERVNEHVEAATAFEKSLEGKIMRLEARGGSYEPVFKSANDGPQTKLVSSSQPNVGSSPR